MPNILIRSRAQDGNGRQLFLQAVQSTPNVIVSVLIGGNDKTQVWSSVLQPGGGVALVNEDSGNVIQCTADEQQGNLKMVSYDPAKPAPHTAWEVDWTGTGAIHLHTDWDLNLNIYKDNRSSGAEVVAWGWGGGDPNDTWDIVPV